MKLSSAYRVVFDAGHVLENIDGHDKQHGHRYSVTVEWEREGALGTDWEEWRRITGLIDALAFELLNRSLNKMLGAQYPNAFGMASFFMERLTINAPITKVTVCESEGPTAIIERDPYN